MNRPRAAQSEEALHARAAPSRCWLIVMAKQPVMGRVKTRLAREAGGGEAIRFYRNTLRTVVGRLAADPRWRTLLAVSPDTAIAMRGWPPGVARLDRIPQGRGDLGTRMQRLLEAPPAGRVILVGTDIPSIRPEHIARAFSLLGSHDAVLGPAEDGGYWLVGLRRCPRILRPFDGAIRWSSADALSDTLANLSHATTALADRLSDVDGLDELRRLGPVASRLVSGVGRRASDPEPRRAGRGQS